MTTDVVTAFAAVYFLVGHFLILSLCIAFIPSTIVSMIIMAKSDLEKYKNSAFGVYIRKYMASKSSDWIRFGGFVVMMVGGWNNLLWLITLGFAVILFVWLKGLIFPVAAPKKQG